MIQLNNYKQHRWTWSDFRLLLLKVIFWLWCGWESLSCTSFRGNVWLDVCTHALTRGGGAFLARIKAEGCAEPCEQQWSDSISYSNAVVSEYWFWDPLFVVQRHTFCAWEKLLLFCLFVFWYGNNESGHAPDEQGREGEKRNVSVVG